MTQVFFKGVNIEENLLPFTGCTHPEIESSEAVKMIQDPHERQKIGVGLFLESTRGCYQKGMIFRLSQESRKSLPSRHVAIQSKGFSDFIAIK